MAASNDKTSSNPNAHRSASDLNTFELEGLVFRDEPIRRAEDLSVARKVGYKNPSQFIALIERWKPELGHVEQVSPTVGETHSRGGRPRKKTYWLTEEQVLFLVTKSETPNAVALTKEMIRVFMLARRGELPNQQPTFDMQGFATAIATATSTAVVTSLAPLLQQILAASQQRTVVQHEEEWSVGRTGSRIIRFRLREYAMLLSAPGDTKAYKHWLGQGQAELRAALGFFGTARCFDRLGREQYGNAMIKLEEMLRRARNQGPRRQTEMFN